MLVLAAGLAPATTGAAERGPAPSFWDPGLHLERPDLSAPARDPLPHRRRLSAARLRARRRLALGLQRRYRARDLRGAAHRLHHPGAPLGHVDQLAGDRQGRRGDRLDSRQARPRASGSTSPSPITRRRRASRRARIRPSPTRRRRRSPAKRSASSPARRINPISRRSSPARRPSPIRISPRCTTR